MKTFLNLSLAALVATLSTSLMAHTGHGTAAGLTAGFTHPFLGLDHLLAMVAVGVWAAQSGKQALWSLPTTFVALMALGGTLGLLGLGMPYVEYGILLSVIVLGALIATASRFPKKVNLLLVGGFALFHGFAHGAEIPLAANAVLYVLGFLVGTALLHLTGVLAARGIATRGSGAIVRILGGAIALSGLYLGLI